MQIYDVTVRFARTIQVREYEPASAEVTVKAQLAEGEQPDAAVAESFKLISNQVHVALGLPADTKLPKRQGTHVQPTETKTAAAAKVEAVKPATTTQTQAQKPTDDIPDTGTPAGKPAVVETKARLDDIPDTGAASAATHAKPTGAAESLTAAELSKWIGEQVRAGKVTSLAVTGLYPRFGITRFADLKPDKCGEAKAAIEQIINGESL